MLKEEAVWFRENLRILINSQNIDLSTVANIGSSDEKALKVHPWIEDIFLSFVRERGRVYNIDIKQSDSVDIVGNLLDQDFIAQLQAYKFKAALCLNVLPCVRDKEKLAAASVEIVANDGLILVSVSKRHPYVNDPIDNLFRPNVAELHSLFPDTKILKEAIVESESYFQFLIKNKKVLAITATRLCVPFYKFKTWYHLAKYLPKLFLPYQTTCLILQKK